MLLSRTRHRNPENPKMQPTVRRKRLFAENKLGLRRPLGDVVRGRKAADFFRSFWAPTCTPKTLVGTSREAAVAQLRGRACSADVGALSRRRWLFHSSKQEDPSRQGEPRGPLGSAVLRLTDRGCAASAPLLLTLVAPLPQPALTVPLGGRGELGLCPPAPG